MSQPTYDSKCMKCLCGSLHPFHDNGKIADGAETVFEFSQLPPEKQTEEAEERRVVVHDH